MTGRPSFAIGVPALERALHAEFNQGHINTESSRKEFCRVPSIDDVEAAVKRLAPASAFFRDVEARSIARPWRDGMQPCLRRWTRRTARILLRYRHPLSCGNSKSFHHGLT